MSVLRVVAVAAGFAALAVAAGFDPALLGGAAAALAARVGMARGWRRPWSDVAAWSGAAIAFGAVAAPMMPAWETMLLTVVALAGVSFGLHATPASSPRAAAWPNLLAWSLAAAAATILAWAPAIAARGGAAPLEPLAAVGMALRFLGAVALLGVAALALWALRRRGEPSPAVPNPGD